MTESGRVIRCWASISTASCRVIRALMRVMCASAIRAMLLAPSSLAVG